MPPSVIFVSVDTLSARHMSLYGYPRPTTPGLEQLAESSLVFERCWANAPWTAPSYMSQFTGLYAESFLREGPVEDGANAWSFAQGHRTIAELYQELGFRTAAFIDNPNLPAEWGFAQGFDVYDTVAAQISIEETDGGVRHVVPRALAWLDELRSEEPFFLFVQVLDVHGPYLFAGEHDGAFDPSSLPVADRTVPVASGHETMFGAIPRYVAEPLLEEGVHELRAGALIDDYDEGVRAMDDALQDLLAGLEDRGVLDDVVFVLSADHGESMVEHDSYFGHQLLHGEELHVPLLIRPPGGTIGARIDTDVQLVDLYPTLAEFAGLNVEAGSHGRSLAGALRGEKLTEAPSVARGDFLDARSIVLDGWKLVETRPSVATAGVLGVVTSAPARAWIDENYPELRGKIFGTSELPLTALSRIDLGALHTALDQRKTALYDLNQDPGETKDLSQLHPEKVRELRERLEAISSRARAAFLEDGTDVHFDAATRAELEKLGYGGH